MEATIRRLTPEESDNLLQKSTPKPEEGRFPARVRIDWLSRVLGKSDRTLARYRKIAFEEIAEYWLICLDTNPGYILGETKLPDKPPLTQRQAEILVIISKLFDSLKDQYLVRHQLNQFFVHPNDLQE
ncbi:MAG: hypothetical protein F6J86_06170 [Symploca sp. SIO1B1]|nr:hypothetical protein [Symploca sp. SIO2G7]NER47120.1 hypothetical protein [Symploca sp. SIO1A3]NER93408.1 hypothetical protein [Symploca sp. SIO1B1]NES17911.1 hypothetical protein [Caldora sp. SIO3E6]